MSQRKDLIIIGNGMVGHHFVDTFRALNGADQWRIHIIGEERHSAYDRVHLSEYFQGRSHSDLALGTSEGYQQAGIAAHLGTRVERIDRAAHTVLLSDGEELCYDKLVLATGSYPFVPPIPGHDAERCFVYRTLDDLDAIRSAADQGKTGVVIGGGLLGLEAANALTSLGLTTEVIEFAPRLMPVQLDATAGTVLKDKIEALGVRVHTDTATQQIETLNDGRLRLHFADGEPLETDVLVFSAGIRPRDELARQAGLKVGERGGVCIDNHGRTSDNDIYAIGEVALWDERIFGLVAPGYRMAETVAAHLEGCDSPFLGADMSTKLKLLGVDVGAIGDAHGTTPGTLSFRYHNEAKQQYKKIVTSADGKRLLGAILVGDNSAYDSLLQYYLNDIALPAEPDSLILPSASAAPALGPDALPDSATICSCMNVTKGGIVTAIDGGCCSVAEVKAETRASSSCGGCAAMLKNLVDATLEARGVEVDHSLCEHFSYTRQALYHLVQVEQIKTFDELIRRHGRGHGCDICKPAVASILASHWNEGVHDAAHVKLQDTNDTFLANMQKDGTYSIVPRIAGGEITPDKLLVIGQVAKDYRLYTKITGGQRIDLFGAQLHQLPEIWQRLIDAGFETGHAYGKALRTVKSCVGSTWCRYGQQDSVGMAILLENRYKGLRAPHKIKFAVSGCTRECAEAQSKDIGVIATENGWNLYVCGNGGMKPRHADLFATDLDDVHLIRTIDRLLMFYVRTADRLQRTARWMESLEGGLDYLTDVILNDCLNLGEELDQQMARIVDTYQCEWKATLEDEQKLKRFRTFVNSPAGDDNILFVEERDQIRPATHEEKNRLIASA
ncbi:nitrite reductase large subunit [Saccharospirillum sp. MSK14-1]|uniref:nitrite reductase large subunit NirB n=1 Tax=Saccharospirillum sp. MSK14-1 TaxID=1897632 RepID=UPI000D382EF0|nr:nitrite reductase large subunit NirB [Saccharospirillum sp. MSK14-1]PTY36242.1 nitrite reductase large subunit [Saccharospirillum sp. MSK14-1]